MPTDTTVKFFHSAMSGAPSLAGQAGSLITLLDALLVNGFGLQTVDSIVISGGVGTITRGAGLPFEPGSVMLIAGATVTGGSINGERKAIATTTTTATFDATGISNQTAGGTITAKFAPLGWAKTYTGTNLAAYKPTDIAASGCLLRIDDTPTTIARARAYEAMTDVNTGTGLTPTDTNVSGGLYWPKSATADATARGWILAGDGRVFYLMVAYSTTSNQVFGFNHVFGDIAAVKSPDPYACIIHGFTTSSVGTAGNNAGSDFDYGDGTVLGAGTYTVRGYAGLGGNIAARKSFPSMFGANTGKSGAIGIAYPNYADGGLYAAPVYIGDSGTTVYRGLAPGLVAFPQVIGATVFGSRDYVTGAAGYAGKTLRVVNSGVGCFAFDTTGPWR